MTITVPAPPTEPFGTVFAPTMPVSRHDGVAFGPVTMESISSFTMHPGAHALHYGSSCFEGLKAHRQPDGTVVAFRAERHAERMAASARRLRLPVPPTDVLLAQVAAVVEAHTELTPASPGALYLRPTLLGTDESIGAAASPSLGAVLYTLACPVGDYLPPRPLTIAVETQTLRTTSQFGSVKTGANYAMALGTIADAKEQFGADQVLFAPRGVLQETGASNIMLLDEGHVVTPALSDALLHGVTRDSLLQLTRHEGRTVEERDVTVEECVAWAARPGAEIVLTGTAAVLAAVGELVVDGVRIPCDPDHSGSARLRQSLLDVQAGRTPFTFS